MAKIHTNKTKEAIPNNREKLIIKEGLKAAQEEAMHGLCSNPKCGHSVDMDLHHGFHEPRKESPPDYSRPCHICNCKDYKSTFHNPLR